MLDLAVYPDRFRRFGMCQVDQNSDSFKAASMLPHRSGDRFRLDSSLKMFNILNFDQGF